MVPTEPKYILLKKRPVHKKRLEITLACVTGISLLALISLAAYRVFKNEELIETNLLENMFKAVTFTSAAVAADSKICSSVGASILKQNGSAVDAAIATMFCSGAVNIHSCGLGGGGFMVVYIRKEKKFHVLDYRGVAPGLSTSDMFLKNQNLSRVGGLSIAVPGEVKGLWEAHQKFGKLPWANLIEPAIKLADDGFPLPLPVYRFVYGYMIRNISKVSDGLRELFMNADGSVKKVGDLLVNKKLAQSLRIIQKENGTSFYTGSLSQKIVNDMKSVSGILSGEDLSRFQVKHREILQMNLTDDLVLNTMPAPGSGAVVAMILNIMKGYDFSKHNLSDIDDVIDFYQKFIESEKFSFAQRALLGDPEFMDKEKVEQIIKLMTNFEIATNIRKNKITLNETHNPSYYGGFWGIDDFGTSHLSVLSENGDAVSVTTTLNFGFGSLYRSKTTGIVYNNNMNDFSTPGQSDLYGLPPTPYNYIEPFKTPMSSMSPTILTNRDGDVKFVIGASGGTRIISAVAVVLLKNMKLKMELGEAVSSWRLHHQGIPNCVTYYKRTPPPENVIQRLQEIGHVFLEKYSKSVVQVIKNDTDCIYAVSDPRKKGLPDGY